VKIASVEEKGMKFAAFWDQLASSPHSSSYEGNWAHIMISGGEGFFGRGLRAWESFRGSGDIQFRVQNAKPAALPALPSTAVERKVRIMPILYNGEEGVTE
jgi:hypothetical protein